LLKSKFLLVLLFSISAVYICKGVNATINKEISAIAKNINVKILGPSGNGSGVIIKSDLNEYLVLTAWHVIKDLNEKDDLDIKTYDGVLHNYSKGSIYKIKNVDLGVLMFESFNEYKVAEIGKVGNSKMGDKIYVFGFPLPSTSIEKSIPRLQPGQITANSKNYNKDGYQLLYTNRTLPGMSGGSILNENGKLIGIHGRSEIDKINSYGNKLVSTGTNMGIPISYFEDHILKQIRIVENKSPQVLENKVYLADDFLVEAFSLLNQDGNELKMLMLAKKSVSLKPNALGYALIGRAQEILNDSNSALENYQKSIELNPNIELANKYLAKNLPNKKAIKLYEKLIKDFPNNNDYFYLRALRRLDDGDINGSLEDLENGIKIYKSLKDSYCKIEPLNNLDPYFYMKMIEREDPNHPFQICKDLEKRHAHLLERAGNTLFVLNKTKKACIYWKDRFENYFWRAKMSQYSGFYDRFNDIHSKFVVNNKNFNIERAKEMSSTFYSNMDLQKYIYKYCLNYY